MLSKPDQSPKEQRFNFIDHSQPVTGLCISRDHIIFARRIQHLRLSSRNSERCFSDEVAWRWSIRRWKRSSALAACPLTSTSLPNMDVARYSPIGQINSRKCNFKGIPNRNRRSDIPMLERWQPCDAGKSPPLTSLYDDSQRGVFIWVSVSSTGCFRPATSSVGHQVPPCRR